MCFCVPFAFFFSPFFFSSFPSLSFPLFFFFSAHSNPVTGLLRTGALFRLRILYPRTPKTRELYSGQIYWLMADPTTAHWLIPHKILGKGGGYGDLICQCALFWDGRMNCGWNLGGRQADREWK